MTFDGLKSNSEADTDHSSAIDYLQSVSGKGVDKRDESELVDVQGEGVNSHWHSPHDIVGSRNENPVNGDEHIQCTMAYGWTEVLAQCLERDHGPEMRGVTRYTRCIRRAGYWATL